MHATCWLRLDSPGSTFILRAPLQDHNANPYSGDTFDLESISFVLCPAIVELQDRAYRYASELNIYDDDLISYAGVTSSCHGLAKRPTRPY